MAKHKKPAYYVAPLRKRSQIIEWLLAHRSYHRNRHESSPLAWNVKCYDVDLSPEHLIEVYRTSGEYNRKTERWLDYPEWREPALEKYMEIEDELWEWAVEDARRGIVDDDFYKSLWNGGEVDVEYQFSGRSGGWLIITRYEGVKLEDMYDDDFREYLEGLDYKALRKLYEFVVQCDHDFRKEAVRNALEWAAAEAWIYNVCRNIPRPEKTQSELPLGFEG